MPSYSGVWTLSQQFQGRGQGLWPSLPGAPTIGTATAGTALCATVTFTAPACRGVPNVLTYTVTSTPGGVTTTGAASPLVVTGLTAATAYTFRVKATNGTGTGPCSAASNSVTAKLASCVVFSTAGTFSWVVPSGVTSIAAVVVGGGGGARGGLNYGGGGGGGLAYRNAQSVTPGETLTVIVGAGGTGGIGSATSGAASRLQRSGSDLAAAGGGLNGSSRCGGSFISGTSGGQGGRGGWGGGGGPSYSGAGGNGGCCGAGFQPGGSGGGGGGGLTCTTNPTNGTPTLWSGAGGGGGVGLYGAGTGGAGGCAPSVCAPSTIVIGGGGGRGGSPSTGTGTNGAAGGLVSPGLFFNSAGGAGGFPGGGGGSGGRAICTGVIVSEREGGNGGLGAVRIVWNGCGRGVPSFPTTNVGPS